MFLQPIPLERRSLTLRVDRNHTRATTVLYLQSETGLYFVTSLAGCGLTKSRFVFVLFFFWCICRKTVISVRFTTSVTSTESPFFKLSFNRFTDLNEAIVL